VSLKAYLPCGQDQTSFHPTYPQDSYDKPYKNCWYSADEAFAVKCPAVEFSYMLVCSSFIRIFAQMGEN